jgi:hypothetical protein
MLLRDMHQAVGRFERKNISPPPKGRDELFVSGMNIREN